MCVYIIRVYTPPFTGNVFLYNKGIYPPFTGHVCLYNKGIYPPFTGHVCLYNKVIYPSVYWAYPNIPVRERLDINLNTGDGMRVRWWGGWGDAFSSYLSVNTLCLRSKDSRLRLYR